MEETENEKNNENINSEPSHENINENINTDKQNNLSKEVENFEENQPQEEQQELDKEKEIEESPKENENLRYQQEEEEVPNNDNIDKKEKEEEKEKEELNEEKVEKEEKEEKEEAKEEAKEEPNYIENIINNQKLSKNKRLPKISKMAKSLTDNSINRITTNLTENKKDEEISKMYKKILDFTKPKIRNKRYDNIQTMDNIFLQMKKDYETSNINNLKELNQEEFEKEQLAKIEKLKNPFKLTHLETKKYLELYNCDQIKEEEQSLKSGNISKNYKSTDFNTTRFSEAKAFKIFYSKMRRDNEIIRKGGINLKTPSFNLIRATKKFNVVPNPVGIVKRKGEINKIEMRNKLCGDNYLKCLCESLKISEHITEINLQKNRLSDFSIIQLFNTIIKNNILLKRLVLIDLSYNKLGFAGTEIICKYIAEYDCNLEHFNLEANNLGNNNSRKIVTSIYQYLEIKIKYLNLGQNILNDEIASDLTTLINKCRYLNVLILYQNQFTNQGAGLMMSEIKNHTTLKILDLSWNLIGTNLTDEIPTLDELIKASSKQEQKKNFDNAYLNELKFTMQFRRPGTLSPVRVGSKVSYFTSQLCELFHNKSIELVHLDISYNNINAVDAKAISENIKDNHTILGIHVDGNDMWVDELGFVFPIEKKKYKQNHFAQSQIFYRIANEHPLSRSNIINVQKLRSKNNCWICEGWREIKFHYKPSKYEGDLESAYVRLHLNFENYKSFRLNLEEDSFVCHRM